VINSGVCAYIGEMASEMFHALLGAGVRAARQRKNWNQGQAAQAFRNHGLLTWRKSTVGQMEAGLRRPGLDELLLMCAALETSLGELLSGGNRLVGLCGGAKVSQQAMRALLRDFRHFRELPAGEHDFPMTDPLMPGISRPSDEERHAAKVLRMTSERVMALSRELWGRSLPEERDARLADTGSLSARSLQARRGLIARDLFREIRECATASGTRPA
jgi:hypothetical protein